MANPNEKKPPAPDDAQWLAQCLESFQFNQLADELKKLHEHPSYNKLMSVYNSTKYNNNETWYKTFNANLYELDSIYEYKIRDIFFAVASVDNLVVASTSDLAKFINATKNKYVTDAIKKLCERGIITIVQRGSGTRATKYMVNPRMRIIGKPDIKKLQTLFDQFSEQYIAEATKENPLVIVDFMKMAKRIYSFVMERPKHKVKKDFEDHNTLICNRFSLTQVVTENKINDDKKQKKAPVDSAQSASAITEELPFK